MGLADRQYMHDHNCSCEECKQVLEKDKTRKQEEFEEERKRFAVKKKKDKEFSDNLNRMLNIVEKDKIEDPEYKVEKQIAVDKVESKKIYGRSSDQIRIDGENRLKCPRCGCGTLEIKIRGRKFRVCSKYDDKCKWKIEFK